MTVDDTIEEVKAWIGNKVFVTIDEMLKQVRHSALASLWQPFANRAAFLSVSTSLHLPSSRAQPKSNTRGTPTLSAPGTKCALQSIFHTSALRTTICVLGQSM